MNARLSLSILAVSTLGLAAVAGASPCSQPSTAAADHAVVPASMGDPKGAASAMGEKAKAAAKGDIVDIAASNPDFSTLVTAVKKAGLVETLKGKGPFTVFAPTNAAFAKIDPKTLEALLADKAALTNVLTYHVVPGGVMAADVVKLTAADAVNNQRIAIDASKGVVLNGNVKVVTTDIQASNGVIHVIDTVLMPETKDIVGVATSAGSFNTLAKLLTAAGLVDTLKGTGPFTVFAPTDDAFAKLPKETLESLLKPENKAKLTQILTYHVVPARVYSNQALAAKTAKTVNGQSVEIAVVDGKAKVNAANLVKTDINASNGVIHVVDTVLLPK